MTFDALCVAANVVVVATAVEVVLVEKPVA